MSESIDRRASRGTAVLAAVCVAAVILPLSFSAGAISTPATPPTVYDDAN
jgi:hypothetical protein